MLTFVLTRNGSCPPGLVECLLDAGDGFTVESAGHGETVAFLKMSDGVGGLRVELTIRPQSGVTTAELNKCGLGWLDVGWRALVAGSEAALAGL